jgi:uncharacterized membrane protein
LFKSLAQQILWFLENLFGTSILAKCLITLLISIIPFVELRGAIPIGAGVLGLPVHTAALISLIGNMIPIPFIIIFARKIFAWMRKKSPRLGRMADRLENKAKLKGARLYRSQLIGLMIFVAIPLPGTGAWTGALIAAILDIRLKAALPAICAGVVIAGILISGITYGFTSLLY